MNKQTNAWKFVRYNKRSNQTCAANLEYSNIDEKFLLSFKPMHLILSEIIWNDKCEVWVSLHCIRLRHTYTILELRFPVAPHIAARAYYTHRGPHYYIRVEIEFHRWR